jgi:seryl-tRNA synthetase
MKTVIQDSTTIRTVFEELREKVEPRGQPSGAAREFLEVEKPFSLIHGEADALRSQVESTSEHLGRIREQHERLMDSTSSRCRRWKPSTAGATISDVTSRTRNAVSSASSSRCAEWTVSATR